MKNPGSRDEKEEGSTAPYFEDHMKKRNWYSAAILVTAGMLCLSAAACGQKTEETKAAMSGEEKTAGQKSGVGTEKETEETLDYENMTAEELIQDYEGQEKLSDEDFVRLTSTYRYVPITENLELDYSKDITGKAFQLLDDQGIEYHCSEASMKALLGSEYPQVRGKGFEWMPDLFGLSDANAALAKEALKTEKDPYVLKAAIQALGNEGGANPDVAAFLLAMAKHENPRVREQAAAWIGSPWNQSMEGAVEAELSLMQDEDNNVAKMACEYSGALGDDRFIAPLGEILDDNTRYELHSACMDSLARMWLDFPSHENTNPEAYRVSMEYLKKTPRDANVPAWAAISTLCDISEDSFRGWKEKADYYDAAELIDAMTEIIKDPDAAWLSRSSAIQAVKSHGGKEALEALKPVVDGLTDKDAEQLQSMFETLEQEN